METITSPPNNDRSGGGNHFVSAVIGGAVVAAAFVVLLLSGVISGKQRTVIQQGVSTSSAAGGEYRTVNSIYKQSAPGVVSIKTRVRTSGTNDIFGTQQQGLASGTGVVVDKKGYIVTNAHVVENNQSDPTVQFRNDKSVTAKIVGRDPSNDIAVLKVDPKRLDLKPLELGDSSKLEVGVPVIAIGSPFGLDQTVTTGIVSALQRQITAPNNFTISNVIQTDAAINPGNSGGPLLDSEGKVIGINSQIATSGSSEGNVGIGFAVPIDTIKKILPDLESNGKVEYAYLGVSTQTLTPDVAGRLNFGGLKQGALVACVVAKGPADKAGMQAGNDSATLDGQQVAIGGDLIVKFDGKDIKSNEDVSAAVVAKKVGDAVDVEIVRKGDKKTLKVKLAARPANTENNCSRISTSP